MRFSHTAMMDVLSFSEAGHFVMANNGSLSHAFSLLGGRWRVAGTSQSFESA
jgi:hypothetical protein